MYIILTEVTEEMSTLTITTAKAVLQLAHLPSTSLASSVYMRTIALSKHSVGCTNLNQTQVFKEKGLNASPAWTFLLPCGKDKCCLFLSTLCAIIQFECINIQINVWNFIYNVFPLYHKCIGLWMHCEQDKHNS